MQHRILGVQGIIKIDNGMIEEYEANIKWGFEQKIVINEWGFAWKFGLLEWGFALYYAQKGDFIWSKQCLKEKYIMKYLSGKKNVVINMHC